MYDDESAWNSCHIDDLWIFDKLILSKKLGYICGPRGVKVPKPDVYIVRPIMNLMGMGLGSSFQHIQNLSDHIASGSFWCEIFKGRHLSVDYYKGKQILCVEGFRGNSLNRWKKWQKVNDNIPLPEILKKLKGSYDYINVEYIGGNIIEVHLRNNPDFQNHNSDFVIPVWNDQQVESKPGLKFIESKDADRLGFYIEEDK